MKAITDPMGGRTRKDLFDRTEAADGRHGCSGMDPTNNKKKNTQEEAGVNVLVMTMRNVVHVT